MTEPQCGQGPKGQELSRDCSSLGSQLTLLFSLPSACVLLYRELPQGGSTVGFLERKELYQLSYQNRLL